MLTKAFLSGVFYGCILNGDFLSLIVALKNNIYVVSQS